MGTRPFSEAIQLVVVAENASHLNLATGNTQFDAHLLISRVGTKMPHMLLASLQTRFLQTLVGHSWLHQIRILSSSAISLRGRIQTCSETCAQMVVTSVATPQSWSLNISKLSSSRTVVSPASRCFVPVTSQARRARAKFTVFASSNEGDETKDPVTSSTSTSVTEDTNTSPAPQKTISEKRAQAEAEVKKGQRTAFVTGAISVLLGVGYLVLIQLLDTRGVILVPPPPEAFNP